MPVYVHRIETLLPPASYAQSDIAAALLRSLPESSRRAAKTIHQLYSNSGIERRHSVVEDFAPGAAAGIFYEPTSGSFRCPSTGARNELYTRSAKWMLPCVAERATEDAPGPVTHLITVSCTGFFQPGPDFAIMKALDLPAGVERYHLGFMGCYAAFPALRMAKAFCQQDPDAVVLVVCLELCSLHIQWTESLDDLLAGSVFADGAAAAVVSARPPTGPALTLDAFASALAPARDDDMAWTIGDTGFLMRLSSYVPGILEANLLPSLAPLLQKSGRTKETIDRWAVHPGGRAILDRVERGLGLPGSSLKESREVLKNCGNMSSATVLFVLGEMLRSQIKPGEAVVAMAFGPGLTVETALLSAA